MLAKLPSPRPVLLAVFLFCLSIGFAAADLKAGQDHLLHGRWAEAEKELRAVTGAEKPRALLSLAELCLVTGRYPEGIQTVTPLWSNAAGAAPLRAAAGALLGE